MFCAVHADVALQKCALLMLIKDQSSGCCAGSRNAAQILLYLVNKWEKKRRSSDSHFLFSLVVIEMGWFLS